MASPTISIKRPSRQSYALSPLPVYPPVYTQVIEFSQTLTEPPPHLQFWGRIYFKVPQTWGI